MLVAPQPEGHGGGHHVESDPAESLSGMLARTPKGRPHLDHRHDPARRFLLEHAHHRLRDLSGCHVGAQEHLIAQPHPGPDLHLAPGQADVGGLMPRAGVGAARHCDGDVAGKVGAEVEGPFDVEGHLLAPGDGQ